METWNYPPRELYKSLCLIFDENDDIPKIHRDIAKRKLNKLYKRNQLYFSGLDGEWVWRLACAELMQHRYHWLGWERRSDWCWELCTKDWYYPKWNGRPTQLIVLAEQGIGDEILFASAYEDLLEHNPVTTFEVDHRLLPVMRRSFPRATFVTRYKDNATRDPWQSADYRGDYGAFIPAGNVPKLYRKSVAAFPKKPYLVADEWKTQKWREWLSEQGNPPYVGVSWKGSNTRYVDPGVLMAGTSINLQYNDNHERLIQPPIDLKDEVDEVFALVAALDKVHCVPVWILHVAGSLGIETHVVRSPKMYGEQNNILRWEFGRWDHIDWYGNMTLYPNVGAFEKTKIKMA